MRLIMTPRSLALTMVLVFITQVVGQTPTSDEARITALRSNIQRMAGNAPPAGTSDNKYERTVQNLRIQLRDLLIEKRGGLKVRIQGLRAPGALPEVLAYAQELDKELGGVNSELQLLDRSLGAAAGLPPATPNTNSADQSAAEKAQQEKDRAEREAEKAEREKDRVERANDKAERDAAKNAELASNTAKKEATLAAANAITPAELLKAAAPKEVTESKLPAVTCTDGGDPVSTGNTAPTSYDRILCNLAKNVNKDDRTIPNGEGRIIYLAQDSRSMFLILLAKLLKTTGNDSFVSFINEAQEQRVDQQVGAGSGSSGTTSLVTKGGVPYIWGLAVENGAATQSQSDTTVTFRVNPAGAINAFAKKGFITGYRQDDNDPFLKFLRKTSLGFTFDTSRGSQPGVFTGDKQQLSAFSARFEFVNDRNPLLLKYEKDWDRFNATAGVELSKQIWQTTQAVMSFEVEPGGDQMFKDPALQSWLIETNRRIAAVSTALDRTQRTTAIASVIEEQANLLPVKLVSAETVQALTDFGTQFIAFRNKRKELFDKIAKGKIFTLEYTNTRGVNAPDLSNFNFIAATGMGARIDLTANGSFTFFNKVPAATALVPRPGRIRDFQFAGQVMIPFKIGDGQFDFWFSGRYERLVENASTVAGTIVPGTKGDIAVGQFGLNIPIKSLGIKFPVSVTFANRTELIKEKEVRGHIGFTFNWDTLFSKLKPF